MISFRNESRPKIASSSSLRVVRFAVVQVQVEEPVGDEDTVGLDEARLEEREVVVEDVGERAGADASGRVAATAEARAVAVLRTSGRWADPASALARVERGSM